MLKIKNAFSLEFALRLLCNCPRYTEDTLQTHSSVDSNSAALMPTIWRQPPGVHPCGASLTLRVWAWAGVLHSFVKEPGAPNGAVSKRHAGESKVWTRCLPSLHARNTPGRDHHKCPQTLPSVPREQDHPWLRTPAVDSSQKTQDLI